MNASTATETTAYDEVGAIMAFEEGELPLAGVQELFTHLLASGLVWKLQGMYQRALFAYVHENVLTAKHGVTKQLKARVEAHYAKL